MVFVTVWSVSQQIIMTGYELRDVANSTTALHEIVEVNESILAGKMTSYQNDSGCHDGSNHSGLYEKEEVG